MAQRYKREESIAQDFIRTTSHAALLDMSGSSSTDSTGRYKLQSTWLCLIISELLYTAS